MPMIIPFIPAIVAMSAYALAASTLVTMGLMVVTSLILGAITKPRVPNGFSAEAQGRTQVVRSNVQPRNIIYGRAMTSGPLVFAASSDGGSKRNQYMHLVIALADHECDDIEEIYLGDDPVGDLSGGYPTGGKFLKVWGESKTLGFNVAAGVGSATVTLEDPIRSITSVSAVTESEAVPLSDYSWSPGGYEVTVRGIPPECTFLQVTYDGRRSKAYVRIKKHLGSLTQEADGDLIGELPDLWTRDFRLSGVCYLYVRLEFDADLFPNGLPNIKALVRGKRVLDPRNGNVAWSDNWALCVYDYLRDERGFGCIEGDIDFDTVVTAANVSDELVALAPGKYDRRYRCNGIAMLDKSPRDNLAEMVTASGGTVAIAGGVFRVFAGAYDVPTVTLTESDLRGPVRVQPRMSRKDLFNAVKGTFINPAQSWQPSDFPQVANPLYAQQDGEVITHDISLPFTTDVVMAQRLAKIILERSRQGIVVQFPAKLTAFQLTAYSTVKLTLAKFGWTEKVFRVMSWKMSADGGIDLVLNEEASAVYDWNYGQATVTDPAPDTNLPNPFRVETVGQINMDSGEDQLLLTQTGTVISRVLVTWPAPSDMVLLQSGRVEMQYRRLVDTEWTSLPSMSADTTKTYLAPVEDGSYYYVRARFVSQLGVRSPDWTYTYGHRVIGKLSPPRNITGLSLTVLNGFANLTWDPAPDLDVRHGGQARIRHTTDTLQPSWGSAIDIGGYISGAANSAQLPLLSGVYLAKWIDSTGHESPAATMVITTAPSLASLNIVASVVEQPSFAGAKTGIVFDPALNGIKLIGAGLIDDQGPSDASGLWDDQGGVDGLGLVDMVVGAGGWGFIDSLGGIVPSGTYQFAGSLDLGMLETSRLTAAIDAVSFDTGDQIDFRYELVDTWQSIDGDRVSDTAVSLYVRTTHDDPAALPSWTDWQRFSMGDYEARAFQWKVVLESGTSTHNVVVTGLSVDVDMPDRRESGRDVLSGASANVITFGKPFRVMPVLGITAQNLAQGDYFVITGKSVAGFTITFYSAAGAPVSRKFDWDAVAY